MFAIDLKAAEVCFTRRFSVVWVRGKVGISG